MRATVLIRHEIKSVYEYYEKNDDNMKNSFSNLEKTAICGDIKKTNRMKRFSFVKEM